MVGKRVIVTVDGKKAGQLDDVMAQLRQSGLEVEELNTTLGVTHIVGRFDGDHNQLNREGVVAEPEGWMTEQ